MNPIDAWKAAGVTGDVEGVLAVLAPDAVFISPLTAQFDFHGRDEIGQLLEAVFEVVSDDRYESDVRGDQEAFLTMKAQVRGVELHEFQHLELDPDGAIGRITLAIRPLTALSALTRALGPALARRQGRLAAARKLTVAGAFLDEVVRTGDRKFVPLADPER